MSSTTPSSTQPATFRDVLSNREFRGLYGAATLSWTGDYLARAAVTALIFAQTKSPVMAAAAFAISFVPVALLGPLLAAFAERQPHRRVMIVCDLGRLVLMATLAIPGMPTGALIALLFLSGMLGPPFDSSRSAMLPRILEGDRYPVGLALNMMTSQTTQVVGYALGGVLGAINPRAALLANAVSFGASAVLLRLTVQSRPVVAAERKHLLQETAAGFRVVFGTPILRAIAVMVFIVAAFTIIPEGVAAAWAAHYGGGAKVQGLIMAANPLGVALGGLVLVRALAPDTRLKIVKPLCWVPAAVLLLAALDYSWWVAVAISFIGGFASAGVMAPANALFVKALPEGYRARAFGVMQSGLQISYVVVVFGTGWMVERLGVPTALGLAAAAGLALTLLASRPRWQ